MRKSEEWGAKAAAIAAIFIFVLQTCAFGDKPLPLFGHLPQRGRTWKMGREAHFKNSAEGGSTTPNS